MDCLLATPSVLGVRVSLVRSGEGKFLHQSQAPSPQRPSICPTIIRPGTPTHSALCTCFRGHRWEFSWVVRTECNSPSPLLCFPITSLGVFSSISVSLFGPIDLLTPAKLPNLWPRSHKNSTDHGRSYNYRLGHTRCAIPNVPRQDRLRCHERSWRLLRRILHLEDRLQALRSRHGTLSPVPQSR